MAFIAEVHLGSLPAKISRGNGGLGERSSATEHFSAICRSLPCNFRHASLLQPCGYGEVSHGLGIVG
jgi:hypothetical protein